MMKKVAAASFAFVYLQVNVAWAGIPSLPVPSAFQNSIQNLIKTQPEIFVFHSPRPWEEIMKPQQNQTGNTEKIEKQIQREDAPTAVVLSGKTPKYTSDLKGDFRAALVKIVGDKTELKSVTYNDLMKAFAEAKITFREGKKEELQAVFGGDPAKSVNLKAFITDKGLTTLELGNAKGNFTIFMDRISFGRSDTKTADLKFQPKAAPAGEVKPAVSASVPEFSAKVIKADPKAETREAKQLEQKLVGTKISVGGVEVRLKMDAKTKELIPTDTKTGKQITGEVFKAQVKDASGLTREVRYAVDHFKMENGQLVAKGAMHVEDGARFKDGQVGAVGGSGVATSGVAGGPNSRNLDVVVEKGGQIYFQGKAGGGEIVFSAAVTESGKVAMDEAQFNPITAGSENITIKSDLGTVLAEVGLQKEIKTSVGATYKYSEWNIVDRATAESAGGKATLNHFNISESNPTLLNAAGESVGRMTLSDKKEVRQILFAASKEGQAAAKEIFFNDPSAFSKGWGTQKVDVGMIGGEGRATIILNDKSTLSATVASLAKAESQNFSGKNTTQINQAISTLVKADAGIQKLDLSVTMDKKDTTSVLRISAGRDAVGAISAPTLATSNQKVAETLFGKKNVEAAQIRMESVGDTRAPLKFNEVVFSQTGNASLRTTGVFQVPGTEKMGSVTVVSEPGAPSTLQYDRNAAVYFHSESVVNANEQVANKAVEAKFGPGLDGDFSYTSQAGQFTATKVVDTVISSIRMEVKGAVSVTDGNVTNFSLSSEKRGVELQLDKKTDVANAATMMVQVRGATPEQKEQSLKSLFTEQNKKLGLQSGSVRLSDTTVARGVFSINQNILQPLMTLADTEKQTSVSYYGNKMTYTQAAQTLGVVNSSNFKNASDVTKFMASMLNGAGKEKGLESIGLRLGNDYFVGRYAENSRVDVAKSFTGVVMTQSNSAGTVQFTAGQMKEVKGGLGAELVSAAAAFITKSGFTKLLQNSSLPGFVKEIGKTIESFKTETRTFEVNGTKAAQNLMTKLGTATTLADAEGVATKVFENAGNSLDQGLMSVSFSRENNAITISHSALVKTFGPAGATVYTGGAVVAKFDRASNTTQRYVVSDRVNGREAAGQIAGAIAGVKASEVKTVLEGQFANARSGVLGVSREVDGHVYAGSYGRNVELFKRGSDNIKVNGAVVSDTNLDTKRTLTTITGVNAANPSEIISDTTGRGQAIAEDVDAADNRSTVKNVLNQAFEKPVMGVLSVTREMDDHTVTASFGDDINNLSGADITDTNNLTQTSIRTVGDATLGEDLSDRLGTAGSVGEVRTILEKTFEGATGRLVSATRSLDDHTLTGFHNDKVKTTGFKGESVDATGAEISDTNHLTNTTVRTLKGQEILPNGSLSPIGVNGKSAGAEVAEALGKTEGRSETIDAFEKVFSTPKEGVLGASRELLGVTIIGSHMDKESALGADGKNVLVTGARLSEFNPLTNTTASWMKGTAVYQDGGAPAAPVNTREVALELAKDVGGTDSEAKVMSMLAQKFETPITGVAVARDMGDITIRGSSKSSVKTTALDGDNLVAVEGQGAVVEITSHAANRTVQFFKGTAVSDEGGRTRTYQVDGQSQVAGVAEAADRTASKRELEAVQVQLFEKGVPGIVSVTRSIDGFVISGEHGANVVTRELKDGKKELGTGAVITRTDKATNTVERTLTGSVNGRRVDGLKTADDQKMSQRLGQAEGVDVAASVLIEIFGSDQKGVLSLSREVGGHRISGRHGLDTKIDKKGVTTEKFGAVINDFDSKTSVGVETFNTATLDGYSAGKAVQAEVGEANSYALTHMLMSSPARMNKEGVRSVTRDIEGHALQATYKENDPINSPAKAGERLIANMVVLRDTDQSSNLTVTSLNGTVVNQDAQYVTSLNGSTLGMAISKNLSQKNYNESKDAAVEQTKDGKLLSQGILSIERRGETESFRVESKNQLGLVDANENANVKFTGAALAVTENKSGQTITALIGKTSHEVRVTNDAGEKVLETKTKDVDQRRLVGEFQKGLKGLDYTATREKAADMINGRHGYVEFGVYAVSMRSDTADFQVTYRTGENEGKNYEGAVVSERNILTGTSTESLVGTLQGEKVNGLESGDTLRTELGTVSTDNFKDAAQTKLEAGLAKNGVLSASRVEGNIAIRVSDTAAETIVQGVSRVVEQKTDRGWVSADTLADEKGSFTGEQVVSKPVANRAELKTIQKDLASLRSRAQNVNTAKEFETLMKDNRNVGSLRIKIGEGQYWVGQLSESEKPGEETFTQKAVTDKGAESELHSQSSRNDAIKETRLMSNVGSLKTLQDISRYEANWANSGRSHFGVTQRSWVDSDGKRYTVRTGEQDDAYLKDGKGYSSKTNQLLMDDNVTSYSGDDAQLRGGKVTLKDTVKSVSDLEFKALIGLGLGQATVTSTDGKQFPAMVNYKSKKLEVYRTENGWRDGNTGQAADKTFGVQGVDETSRGKGVDVVDFKNGKLESRSQARQGRSAEAIKLIDEKGGTVETLTAAISDPKGSIRGATLYNQKLDLDVAAYGNIVLSAGSGAEAAVAQRYEVRATAFQDNKQQLIDRVQLKKGNFGFDVGRFGRDSMFTRDFSYVHRSGSWVDMIDITAYNTDGDKVGVTVKFGEAKRDGSIQDQLKEKVSDIKGAIQAVRDGWLPGNAWESIATDKNGNGAQMVYDWVPLSSNDKNDLGAKESVKVERGRVVEITRTTSVNGAESKYIVSYSNGEAYRRVNENPFGYQTISERDSETGKWSSSEHYANHSYTEGGTDITDKIYRGVGIIVGAVVAVLLAPATMVAAIGALVLGGLSAMGVYSGLNLMDQGQKGTGALIVGLSAIPGFGWLGAAGSGASKAIVESTAVAASGAARATRIILRGTSLLIGGTFAANSALAAWDNPTAGNITWATLNTAAAVFGYRGAGRVGRNGAEAAKTVGRSAVPQELAAVAAVRNPMQALAGSTFQYYLRDQASRSLGFAIDTAVHEGWTSDTRNAFKTAAWNALVSEIYVVAPKAGGWIGKLTPAGENASLLLRSTPVLLAGAGGAAAGVGWHMLDGGNFSTSGWAALRGAANGLVLALVGRFENKFQVRGTEALKNSNRFVTSFGIKAAMEASPLFINSAASIVTNLLVNVVSGENVTVGQAAYIGAFGGGVMRAMGNWGTALGKMTNASLPSYYSGFDRLKAGVSMGMWEVVFNTGSYSPGQLVGKAFNYVFGLSSHGEDKRSLTTKFMETTLNIASLHPFFSLGRPGQNLATALVEPLGARLNSIGLGGLFNFAVVNPLNISTFGLYESVAVTLADKVGIIDLQKTETTDGNTRYELRPDGSYAGVTDSDNAKAWVLRQVGFLNAPIHGSVEVGQARVQQILGDGQKSIFDRVPGVGGLVSKAKEPALQEARFVAEQLQNNSVTKSDSSDAPSLLMADGSRLTLSRDAASNLKFDALRVLTPASVQAELVNTGAAPDAFARKADGTFAPLRESKAVEGAGKGMDRSDALTMVAETQAGRGDFSAEQIAQARQRVGLADGESLVRVDNAMVRVAQQTFVASASRSQLADMVEGAARGTINIDVGVMALVRSAGWEAAQIFKAAADKDVSPDLLSRIGKQEPGLVQTNLAGEKIIVLTRDTLESSFAPNMVESLPLKEIRLATRGKDDSKNVRMEMVLVGGETGLRVSGLREVRARQIVDATLDRKAGEESKLKTFYEVGLVQAGERMTIMFDLSTTGSVRGFTLASETGNRGRAVVDLSGDVAYRGASREVSERVSESNTATIDREVTTTFINNVLQGNFSRSGFTGLVDGLRAAAAAITMIFVGGASFVNGAQASANVARFNISVTADGRITNFSAQNRLSRLSEYRGALEMVTLFKNLTSPENAGTSKAAFEASQQQQGMTLEGKQAGLKYHERRAELLGQGLTARELKADRELQRLGREYVEKGDLKVRIQSVKDLNANTLEKADAKPDANSIAAKQAALESTALIKDLEGQKATPELMDNVLAVELKAAGQERFLAGMNLDKKKVADLRKEISDMPNGAAKTEADKLLTKVEAHIENKDSNTAGDRFVDIARSFASLRQAVGLESRLDANGRETNAKILVLDKLFAGQISRVDALKQIFDTNPQKLNVGQRLAFLVVVNERFFQLYKKGELKSESDQLKEGQKRVNATPAGKESATIFASRQNVLLVQFMLGRIGGLEAGAGKSPVFLLGIGDYVLSGKAAGPDAKRVGELVVFAPAEVDKYTSQGEYSKLAKALGITLKDGRNLANESPEAITKAKDAFTPKEGEFNLVVSDLHSRGFLERQLRNAPDSDLAKLVEKNVGVLGLDEVDALLLSRMSFISSDANAKASDADISRVKQIVVEIAKAMGIENLDKAGFDVSNRDVMGKESKDKAYYRNFEGRTPTPEQMNEGLWFTSINGQVKVSNKLRDRVVEAVEKHGITGREVSEAFRALVAVSDKDGFGFSKGLTGTDEIHRPTHKSGGQFSHGQIDSSMTFNVAAVLFERTARAFRKESGIDAALPLGDIRLSEAGSMATFVQVLQRNIHRFGATGTPKALEGLSEMTVGLRVVDVAPSTFDRYTLKDSSTKGSEFTVFNALRTQRAESSKDVREIGVIERAGGITEEMAGQLIVRSVNEGSGILAASAREDVLRTMFVGYLARATRGTLTEAAKEFLNQLRTRSDLGIGGLFAEAKRVTSGNAELNAIFGEALGRVRIINGEGNAELIAGSASEGKNVVFATTVGTRALSYNGMKMDLLLAGVDAYTTEGYLQAVARVDRGNDYGARRTIVADKTYLDNRVLSARDVDIHLKTKERPGGLFADNAAMAKLLERVKDKDASALSSSEKLELAAAFASLENRAASALFFIGEQTSSKLLKEPLQKMIAEQTGKAGKDFLKELYRTVLSHSDRGEWGKDAQGVEFMRPSDIAAESFIGGAKMAVSFLTQIARNRSVSGNIRLDAVSRIADIANVLTQIKPMTRDVDAKGLHSKAEFRDAAFVLVSEQGSGSPALMIAKVAAALTDFILPNTQLGKPREGTQVVQRQYSARDNLPADGTGPIAATRVQQFAEELHAASFKPEIASKEKPRGQLLNDTETAVAQSYNSFQKMDNAQRLSAARQLFAAGLISSNPGNNVDNAPTAQQLAAEVVTAWINSGAYADQFNVDVILHASAVIGALPGGISRQDRRDAVVNVASTGKSARQEALARNVLALSKDSSSAVIARANQVNNLSEKSQAQEVAVRAFASSANPFMKVVYVMGQAATDVWTKVFSADRQLSKLGKDERIGDIVAKVGTNSADAVMAYIALARPDLSAQRLGRIRSRVGELLARTDDASANNATVEELITWAETDKPTNLDRATFDKAATDAVKVGESKVAKQWIIGAAVATGLSVATMGLATTAGAGFAAWMGLALVNGFALNNVSKALVQTIGGERQKWSSPMQMFSKENRANPQSFIGNIRKLLASPNGRWTLGTTVALAAAATIATGGMLPVPVLMGLSIGGGFVSQWGKNWNARTQAVLILGAGVLAGIGAMQFPALAAFGASSAMMDSGFMKGFLGIGGIVAAVGVAALSAWAVGAGLLAFSTVRSGETRERALARIEINKQATAVREQLQTEKANAKVEQLNSEIKAQAKSQGQAEVKEKTDVGDLMAGIEKDITDGKIDPKNKYLVLKYALMQEGLSEKRATEVAAKIKAGEKEDASEKDKLDADTLKQMTVDELKDDKAELGLLIELKQFELTIEQNGGVATALALDNANWTFRGDSVQSRDEARVAVYSYLLGRETTAEDRKAFRRLSNEVASFADNNRLNRAALPTLRELGVALNLGSAATLFANLLNKSQVDPNVSSSANKIAAERKDAFGKIRSELLNQGFKPVDVDRFLATLYRYDSMDSAQEKQLIGEMANIFESDGRTLPENVKSNALQLLRGILFNPVTIGRKGIGENFTLSTSVMKMLEGVAYGRAKNVSSHFTQWTNFAPMYRALNSIPLTSGSSVVLVDSKMGSLSVRKDASDESLRSPAILTLSSTEKGKVNVSLAPGIAVIFSDEDGVQFDLASDMGYQVRGQDKTEWSRNLVPGQRYVSPLTYLDYEFRIVKLNASENGGPQVGLVFRNPNFGKTPAPEAVPNAATPQDTPAPKAEGTAATPGIENLTQPRQGVPAPSKGDSNAARVVGQPKSVSDEPSPVVQGAAASLQEALAAPATPAPTARVAPINSNSLWALTGLDFVRSTVKQLSTDFVNGLSRWGQRIGKGIGILVLLIASTGLLPAADFQNSASQQVVATASFSQQSPRFQGTNVVNVTVPTAQGNKDIRFQSAQPFAQTFLAQAGDKTERVFARTVDTVNGTNVIGAGREFRQVTLIGAPAYETGAIRDLAQLLLAAGTDNTPVFKAGSVDEDSLETIQNLLSNPVVRDWVRAIDVKSLLTDQTLPSSIDTNRFQTLGQVADLGREASDFKSFVYALVLFNAESLATRAGTMLSSDSVSRVSRELGGNIVLHHTQPGRALASLEDRLAARRLLVLGGRIGHVNDVPLLVSGSTELTFFDDIRNVILTMDALGKPKEVKPVTLPYQNADLADQNFVNRLSRSDREASPAAKAMAKAALSLAVELFQEKNLSPDQLRVVWGLVQELALGHSVRAEDVLSRAGLAGLGLEQIISELSQQIRALGQANPAVRNFTANGHLHEIGPHIHYYLNISAAPSNPKQFENWLDGSEAEWIISRLGVDIDTADALLLDAKAARERAEELREVVNQEGHGKDVFATLRILAGLYEADFFTRMLGEMKGRFTTMAEVEAALAGTSKDRAAQETALRLLMKPLVYAVLEASNARNPELVDQLMKQIDLSIVTADALPNGKSQTTESRGRISIQIGLDEGLTTQQAFAESVGRLTHELSDVLAHRSLRKYALGELGVPTVLSEAWSALTTERALRWLKLDSIADTLALQTAERIAELEQSQAYYLTYQGLRGKPQVIAALERKVRESRGATQIVVLASENEFEAAQFELSARGIQVASPAQILKITPAGGETALEAHGRLYLGTRAVKLVADEAAFKADAAMERIVMLGGRVVPELLTLLSPAIYTDRLQQIVQEELVARLAGRQA